VTNWTGIAIVAAAELTVLFAATVRCFSAKGRLDRERDGDIRSAIAGYEAGHVIPALTDVIVRAVTETIRRTATLADDLHKPSDSDAAERFRAGITDALATADTDVNFQAAVDASIMSRTPRAMEKTLVYRYTTLGVFLVACHLAGPAALYNVLTSGYNLPHTAVIVATVIFSLGLIGIIVLAILVATGEVALARAIREGKDAA
jgi:hypothetical protein